MPGSTDPRVVDVDVTLNSVTPLDFSVAPRGNSLPTGPGGELIFRNAGHRGFEVHFHLQDNTNLGYRFPPHSQKHEAVWSELGTGKCPSSQVREVFHVIRVVESAGMSLEVLNPNPPIPDPPNPPAGQGKFGYTLRVTNDGGRTYLCLDPGGDNQNGPVSRYDWSAALSGSLAGAVAAIGTAVILAGNTIHFSDALLYGVGGAVAGLIVGFVLGRF